MNTDPDPSELKDFLRSDAPLGSVQFEVPPEVAEEMQPEQQPPAPETPPTRVNIPLDPVYEPDQPLISNVMYWTLEMPNLGTVEVTEHEKTLYLKAVDNDAPVVYEIELPLGPSKLKVEIHSRSVFEERAVFSALDSAAYVRKEFRDPAALASRAQQLMAAVQVTAINEKRLPELDLSPANGSILAAASLIEKHASLVIERMGLPRWGAVLSALRMFEIKLKLCNDNANNETFWEPAS